MACSLNGTLAFVNTWLEYQVAAPETQNTIEMILPLNTHTLSLSIAY